MSEVCYTVQSVRRVLKIFELSSRTHFSKWLLDFITIKNDSLSILVTSTFVLRSMTTYFWKMRLDRCFYHVSGHSKCETWLGNLTTRHDTFRTGHYKDRPLWLDCRPHLINERSIVQKYFISYRFRLLINNKHCILVFDRCYLGYPE